MSTGEVIRDLKSGMTVVPAVDYPFIEMLGTALSAPLLQIETNHLSPSKLIDDSRNSYQLDRTSGGEYKGFGTELGKELRDRGLIDITGGASFVDHDAFLVAAPAGTMTREFVAAPSSFAHKLLVNRVLHGSALVSGETVKDIKLLPDDVVLQPADCSLGFKTTDPNGLLMAVWSLQARLTKPPSEQEVAGVVG